MKISLIQPKIKRGDISYNSDCIQGLIDRAQGDLLILPEYCFTGSLVLDLNADIKEWAEKTGRVIEELRVPTGKHVLVNSLILQGERFFNACQLIPDKLIQYKLFPDEPEVQAGICAGSIQTIFSIAGRTFKTIICSDLKRAKEIPTSGLDFAVFVFHFTENNLSKALGEAKSLSSQGGFPVVVSSLVSDMNVGYSSFIDMGNVISLPDVEGILEIEW